MNTKGKTMKTLKQVIQEAAPMDINTAKAHISNACPVGFQLTRTDRGQKGICWRALGQQAGNVVLTLAHDDTYTLSVVSFEEQEDGLLNLVVVSETTGLYCEDVQAAVASATLPKK